MSSVSASRRGFTLTELLAALAIISLLVAIVLPRISHRVTKARATRAAADIQAIELALDNYLADWGRYPPIIDWGEDMVQFLEEDPTVDDEWTSWDDEERDGYWDNNRDDDGDTEGDPILDEKGRVIANNTLRYMQYVSILLQKRAGGHGPYLPKGVPKDPWGNEYIFVYIPKLKKVPLDEADGDYECDDGEYCQLIPRLRINRSLFNEDAVWAAVGMYYYDAETGERIEEDFDGDCVRGEDNDNIAGPEMEFQTGPPYQKVFIYSRGRDGLDDFGFQDWYPEYPPDWYDDHPLETPTCGYGSMTAHGETDNVQIKRFQSTDAITNWSVDESCGRDRCDSERTICIGWENHPFYN